MIFKIPKKFELLGQVIDVEWSDTLQVDQDEHGTSHFRENKIRIQRPAKGIPMPKDRLEHIFFHELTHWIMYTMNQHELNNNEAFVDTTAGLFYQALKSSKGELKY